MMLSCRALPNVCDVAREGEREGENEMRMNEDPKIKILKSGGEKRKLGVKARIFCEESSESGDRVLRIIVSK